MQSLPVYHAIDCNWIKIQCHDHRRTHVDSIEKIQLKFLRSLSYKIHNDHMP